MIGSKIKRVRKKWTEGVIRKSCWRISQNREFKRKINIILSGVLIFSGVFWSFRWTWNFSSFTWNSHLKLFFPFFIVFWKNFCDTFNSFGLGGLWREIKEGFRRQNPKKYRIFFHFKEVFREKIFRKLKIFFCDQEVLSLVFTEGRYKEVTLE